MIRRRLARLLVRILGPELAAEIKRVAEAEAHHAGAVALTIAEMKLAEAVTALTQQDLGQLRLMEQAFDNLIRGLSGRADALPGETKPAREPVHVEGREPETPKPTPTRH